VHRLEFPPPFFIFQKESFIKAVPSRYTQSFLECFTDTAMFNVFIESRLNKQGDVKGKGCIWDEGLVSGLHTKAFGSFLVK